MASSSPATGGGIGSEDDTSEENLRRIETLMIEAIRRITEIQELMREQNILNSATETARQEERRRRNGCGGWGKWIALGFLALLVDNILGAISLGVAIYWHDKK
ncbi:hypothetical protein BELL_0165g00110 [Botrytis elliptica]|uniref:Uncharacterized protein n=1 Tax=Botrytis elliptica TaxID=278938 RepID=A0A4Z1JRK8_9HELO|nr:hypothetical protein BELL_0165g00110 [Botrytis elliptica]